MAVLAVCACACSRCIGPWAARRTNQRMVADRVARGREGADQVLAFDLAEQHHIPRFGRRRQAALAHRTRLSGTQAGGRARALRTRMAWLPSSRHDVHRSLRIPGLRKGDDSPPRDLVPPGGSRNLPYPTVTDPEDP